MGMMERKKAILLNEPHKENANGSSVQFDADMCGLMQVTGNGNITTCGKNICTPFAIGIGINGTDGSETVDQNRATTGYIRVSLNNTDYYWSGIVNTLSSMACAYNENKQFLGRSTGVARSSMLLTKTGFTYGTPQGTGDIAFVRLTQFRSGSGNINDISTANQMLNPGNSAMAYEPFKGSTGSQGTRTQLRGINNVWSDSGNVSVEYWKH